MMNGVPGIFLADEQSANNALHIDNRTLTGFVGIAEKGPLHTPVLITSFEEYVQIFGSFDTPGYLPFSVYGYFTCGGSDCIVVRVANEKHARKSKINVECTDGKVYFEALSEGVWGNYINARVWHEGEVLTDFTAVDRLEGSWIEFNSPAVVEENDYVRVSLLGHRYYRRVKTVVEKKVILEKPILAFGKMTPDTSIKVESISISVNLSCKDKRENFLHLSPNQKSDRYYKSYINARSHLCTVKSLKEKGLIKEVFQACANGGMDGIADISVGDFIGHYNGPGDYRGLGSLEAREDISLVCMPDAQWFSVQNKDKELVEKSVKVIFTALINHAERFPGRFAILDVPKQFEGIGLQNWIKQFDSCDAAAYYPFIEMLNPLDKMRQSTVQVPPSGSICGCIAAIDREKGIFNAPANVLINDAVGLSLKLEDGEHEFLYGSGINILKYFPGKGIKIWGVRTLSSNADWRYINVRRTFSLVCDCLKKGTQWAVFEPNDKYLRKRIVRTVSGFLLDLWMKGYLSGSTAEQGFYVICNDELNPPETIDKGILTFEVGIAITKPMEYLRICISAEREGANAHVIES
jgi:phage tail sheath protein FI